MDAEQQKLQQEYEQFLKQQQQAGVADAAERLEVQRILLMMQLFDNTTYPAQAEKIQKEIEQNYATAEALMQARYREGLAPYDEVENIRSQRRWFYRNLVLRSSTTSDIRKNQLQILQEELLQEYNDIATSDQVSPYTKLLRRLDYLSATRTAAAIHENWEISGMDKIRMWLLINQ